MDTIKNIVAAVWKWFGTWKQDIVAITLAIVLFQLSKYGIRFLDATAGVYDAGVLQTIFVSFFKLSCYGLMSWTALRHIFKPLWTYFNTDFDNDFKMSNQCFRIKVALSVFFGIILILAMLDRASAAPPKNLTSTLSKGEGVANCITTTAMSQVGVRELTGHNDGLMVETYLASVKLKKGNPWCAAFVAWTMDQCGVDHPESGYCPDWFKKASPLTPLQKRGGLNPKNFKGAAFGLWFQSLRRIAHMGIIVKVEGNYLLTVEGNTNDNGSREGDGVYCKRRLLRQIYAVSKWS